MVTGGAQIFGFGGTPSVLVKRVTNMYNIFVAKTLARGVLEYSSASVQFPYSKEFTRGMYY